MRYPLTVSVLLAAVGLVVACEEDPVAPATTGSISLEFVIPSDSGGGAAPAAAAPSEGTADSPTTPTLPVFKKTTFDAARATAIGPQTKEVTLTLSGSNWTGTIDDLTPGTYRVIVEGLVAGVVDWYGEASGVSVTAGGNTTATVTFDTFVPVLDAVLSPTTSTIVTVTFPAVTFASSYNVQWGTDPTFGSANMISNVTGASVDIDVGGPGVYYVRIQAVNSHVPGGIWSDPESFQVVSTAFSGTLSVTSGGFADLLIVTRDPAIPWDGDEWVEIGGIEPWYVAQNLNTITVLVPDVPLGAQTIEIGDQGPGQVSQTANFNITSRFMPHTVPSTAPDLTGGPFPLEFYISLSTASPDDFYTLAPGTDQGLRVIIEWQTGADLDIYWMDEFASFDVFNYDGAGTSNPEMSTATLPGGLIWRLLLTKWDVTEPPTMARVRIETVALGLITAGQNHSCGITGSGAVYCWGDNRDGQLGDGTNTFRSTPALVPGGLSFRSVDGGSFFTCGVTTGSLGYCWGSNSSGRLGDGTFNYSNVPVAVSTVGSFASVSAGGGHACGVATDATGHCWGGNGNGQLGDGTTSSSNTPLAIGGYLWWEIDAGGSHSCGITTDGDAYCWGGNSYGQLGDGGTTDQSLPVLVQGGETWVSIAAGWWSSCGVTSSREVYCWGAGSYLGDSHGANSSVPVLAVSDADNFESVSMHGGNTCAVTSDGELYCWADGYYGQGGDGTTDFHYNPVQPSSSEFFRSVSAGAYHVCAGTDGGDALCWGRNSHGQLGDGNTPFLSPLSVGITVQSVETGSRHACAVDGSGSVFCWGVGWAGQLGNGLFTDSPSPVTVSAPAPFLGVSAGELHTCGLTTSQQPYCWGYNYFGQLGDGTTSNAGVPTAVSTGFAFNSISAGIYHSCGATTGGSVYCWGYNVYGQLGDGSTTDATTPVNAVVPGFVTEVYTGYGHSCARTTTNAVFCWGYNGNGQLGDGTTIDRSSPTPVVGGIAFQAVRAGEFHTCGISTIGNEYCWGAGGNGRLGDGFSSNRNFPNPVSGPSFQALSPGSRHTCGLSGSTAYCWGSNRFGQFGNGTKTEDELLPILAGVGLGYQQISAGNGFTCGVTTTGALYCWGGNSEGTLGVGYRSIETTPVYVGGLVLQAPRGADIGAARGSKARTQPPRQ
jgi:alpha-tubulin suppressor-like RCC1 family protein